MLKLNTWRHIPYEYKGIKNIWIHRSEKVAKKSTPTVRIIEIQSVKTSQRGSIVYDAGKKS